MIQGLVEFNSSSYVAERWHGTLLTIAVMTLSLVANTLFSSRLHLVLGFALILHVVGLFVICITLLAMAPSANAKDAILKFQDNGGWGNTGLSAMIGLIYAIGPLTGYDCSV